MNGATDRVVTIRWVSIEGRDICPSCATRRMVETAAHMVDSVLPRVPFRQWVLSVPKRIRWHMRHKPQVVSALLGIFLRAVETTLRKQSPGAPVGARFGAVAFVHRAGSYLNPHVHYHVLVTPPRIHKHRYLGVLSPNAGLRRAVTETAGPAGATLLLLEQARDKMGLRENDTNDAGGTADDDGPEGRVRRTAARCWALLLARIYECLPLFVPHAVNP